MSVKRIHGLRGAHYPRFTLVNGYYMRRTNFNRKQKTHDILVVVLRSVALL